VLPGSPVPDLEKRTVYFTEAEMLSGILRSGTPNLRYDSGRYEPNIPSFYAVPIVAQKKRTPAKWQYGSARLGFSVEETTT
jgi:hypothetical protein